MSTTVPPASLPRGRAPGANRYSRLTAKPPHPVLRVRFQLVGGLLFAVLLPALARAGFDVPALRFGSLENAVLGTAVALILGYGFFRRLSQFPGSQGSDFIVPTFMAAYGVVIAAFLFLRIDYARFQLMASFILCVAWFYLVHFLSERVTHVALALVPGGATGRLEAIGGVDWIRLAEPSLEAERVDAVVADLRADLDDDWERFVADCAVSGVPVFHVKQVMESVTGRVEIEHLSENTFGSLVPNLAYLKTKEVVDWIGALVLVVLLLPLFAVVALVVRLDSRGPALFRQKRMGYRGRPFTVFKFRTMVDSGIRAGDREAAQTKPGDERITRVGRFLRRTRIDELPQLFNVLSGQMSLIGPRPEVLSLSKWYEAELPFYRYRHVVKPGITGWAQINQGHVAAVDQVRDKLHYDFYYIKNFSPWLDLLIILRTIAIVLTGFGAR